MVSIALATRIRTFGAIDLPSERSFESLASKDGHARHS